MAQTPAGEWGIPWYQRQESVFPIRARWTWFTNQRPAEHTVRVTALEASAVRLAMLFANGCY
jgi:hypothetical protein